MCLNINFLSLILCMMFLLLPIFLISSFVIFVSILHLEFFGSISSQMPSVCSCLFSSTSMFHYNYAGHPNVSLGLCADGFAFPDVLEL